MSKKIFFKWIFAALFAVVATAFTGCADDPEDIKAPELTVNPATLTFTAEGGSQTVEVTANCDWSVTAPEWFDVQPTSGTGNATLTVTAYALEETAAKRGVIYFTLYHSEYGEWGKSKNTVTVTQSRSDEPIVEEVFYFNDFDKEKAEKTYGTSGESWPYLDQFEGWMNQTGVGAELVTYDYKGMSARSNSESNGSYSDYDGSGVNNMFFGSSAHLTIEKIAVTTPNLHLSFGGEKYLNGADDNSFLPSEFTITLSADGQSWSNPINYTAPEGSGRWNVGEADFTLPEGTETLYVRFAASVASAYRVDDVKIEGGLGGQQISFNGTGENPTPGGQIPEGAVEVTVQEFLNAAEDDTIYVLKGEISRVVKEDWGNFDLTDETGTVYIYGLLSPDGEKKVQFQAAGLKQGDTITLYGQRSSYNGEPQMADATYVSHNSGQGGGEKPGPDTDAIYSNDFDKEAATKTYGNGSSWPYLDQFEGWKNEIGTGAANVTYDFKGVSARDNSNSNSQYSDYAGSGVNNIFFGSSAYFTIGNIALSTNKLNLTFGGEKYLQGADNTFLPSEFTITLSADGQNWSAPIAYTAPAGQGRWNVGSADFTLPEGITTLYIKFEASVASAYRIDDVILSAGEGGQEVNMEGGETPTPTPGEVAKGTVAEFLAAADTATTYELTGEITRVANTTYGNFDLTDATGTIYVYGLLTPDGEAQKQWAAAGLKQGDTITVRGVYSEYDGKAQIKNAVYVSHTPGEGGGSEDPVTPVEGDYASDAAFVCTADSYQNPSGLGDTTIGGNSATGFKLGTSKLTGVFTSSPVGVSGDKYLNFYAVAWKGNSATLYVRVDGVAVGSFALAANDGATGNPPYNALAPVESDHYSIELKGLTASSVIEFSTSANYANDSTSSGRAIVFGVKLTDEPLAPEVGGGDEPEQPEQPEKPEEASAITVAEFLAAADTATTYELTGEITRVVNTTYGNFDLTDATGTIYVYGLLTPDGEAQKQWAAAGLKQGDKITITGVYSLYNDAPQFKNAVYVSHTPGEGGGNEDPVTPVEGDYASDAAFVCTADSYQNPSGLGATVVGGNSATGFKLGTSKLTGVFTSLPVGVSGDRTLSFYAVAWKGKPATLYVRVDGVEVGSFALAANDGATGNPPYSALNFAETDHYSINLKGLTESSVIEFSTSANYANDSNTSGRAILCGIKLN